MGLSSLEGESEIHLDVVQLALVEVDVHRHKLLGGVIPALQMRLAECALDAYSPFWDDDFRVALHSVLERLEVDEVV